MERPACREERTRETWRDQHVERNVHRKWRDQHEESRNRKTN